MIALVATAGGVFAVDLETRASSSRRSRSSRAPAPSLNLPRVVAAAEAGSTVVAVVDARPPMLVSHDAGTTWRESGRGLPPGRAVGGRRTGTRTSLVYAAREPALRLARRRRVLEGARRSSCRRSRRSRSRNPELAARDDDRRAADAHALDPVGRARRRARTASRAGRARRPARSRSPRRSRCGRGGRGGRRAGRPPSRSPDPRATPSGRGEHARLPAARPSRAKQFTPASANRASAAEVRRERGHLARPSRARRRRGPGRGRTTRPAAPSARPRATASSSSAAVERLPATGSAAPSSRNGSAAPSRSSSTGTTPAPVSSRSTIFCSGPPSTNAAPSVGWPGERQLARGREDPDPDVGVLRLRREHEHRLGEVHLLRERLHRQRVEIARVGEDGELVARERRVGEDVGDDVAEAAHRRAYRRERSHAGLSCA